MKKILVALLIISLVLEASLTFLCFFKPAAALNLMAMEYSGQLAFAVYLIAWFLLLITVVIAWLLYAVLKNKQGYKKIIYLLGIWWVAIGLGIYLFNGTATNLLTDSAKGLLLIFFTRLQKK